MTLTDLMNPSGARNAQPYSFLITSLVTTTLDVTDLLVVSIRECVYNAETQTREQMPIWRTDVKLLCLIDCVVCIFSLVELEDQHCCCRILEVVVVFWPGPHQFLYATIVSSTLQLFRHIFVMIKFQFNITFVLNPFLFTFTCLIWSSTCKDSFVADNLKGSLPIIKDQWKIWTPTYSLLFSTF